MSRLQGAAGAVIQLARTDLAPSEQEVPELADLLVGRLHVHELEAAVELLDLLADALERRTEAVRHG